MTEMSRINPLNMDIILKTVLEYTGRDLLNCRLVNHRWNKIGVEILKARGCRITINATTLYKYHISLLKSQLQDPSRKLIGLDLHIDLNLGISDHIGKLNEAVAILAEQPCFATSLKLVTRLNDVNFCKLIQVTAPRLQKLHISGDCQTVKLGPSPYSKAFDFRFPELLSIDYHSKFLEELPPQTLIQIVNAAPKLRTLFLARDISEIERYFHPTSITEPLVRGILHGIITNTNRASLKELEIPIHGESTIQALLNLQYVNLEILKIHQDSNQTVGKLFAQFWTANCQSLYSISVYYHRPATFNSNNYFQVHFPQLPRITHFGYYAGVKTWDEPNIAKHIANHLAVAAKRFPSLRTVSTDFGACKLLAERFLASGNVFPVDQSAPKKYQNVEFPGVLSLNVKARLLIHKISEPVLRTVSLLHRMMYPNLNEVVIQFEDLPYNAIPPYDTVVAFLNHNGVKRADISSYPQDWLSGVDTHPQDVYPAIQGLNQLRLRLPPKKIIYSFEDGRGTRTDTPILNLQSLMNMFPRLTLLQLDVELLNDGESTSKQLQDKLDAFKIQFPTLQIVRN